MIVGDGSGLRTEFPFAPVAGYDMGAPQNREEHMQEEQDKVVLPEELQRHFWDHDPDRLSWEEGRHTIVRRLLESRGMQAERWLREHLSNDEIREFIVQRRGGRYQPATAPVLESHCWNLTRGC